jgi:hypothetical protein
MGPSPLRDLRKMGGWFANGPVASHGPAAPDMRVERSRRPGHTTRSHLYTVASAVRVLERRMRHRDVVAFVVDILNGLPVDWNFA